MGLLNLERLRQNKVVEERSISAEARTLQAMVEGLWIRCMSGKKPLEFF